MKAYKPFLFLFTVLAIVSLACASSVNTGTTPQSYTNQVAANATQTVAAYGAQLTTTAVWNATEEAKLEKYFEGTPGAPTDVRILPIITSAAGGSQVTIVSTAPAASVRTTTMLDVFNYTWSGSSLNPATPHLFDAQSTGIKTTIVYDIGIKTGQLGVLKGYSIDIAGTHYGDPAKTGCAGPIILTPGYYKGITMTDARWEIYDLPQDDMSGWSRVLGDQAAQVEHDIYGCELDPTNTMPVYYSDVVAPFGP